MIKFIQSMWWFVKKNLHYYISIFFIGIFQAIILLVPAKIIGSFTSKITNNELTKQNLLYICIASFLFTLLIYGVTTVRKVIQNRLKVKLFYALQIRYMENIIIQDAVFFENFQSGDLLTRALGDVKSVQFSGGNRLLNVSYEMTVIIANLIAMILISPKLSFWAILPLPLIFVTNILLKIKVKKNWKMVRKASSEMGNVVLESISNVHTIRAFSKEDENYDKNLKYSQNVYNIEKKNLAINVIFQPIFQSIVAVSLIISYFFATRIITTTSTLTVALFVQFIIYLNALSGPLTNIGNMLTNFYQSIISLDRLNEIYNSKSDIVDKNDAIELKKIDRIDFKDFSFTYPNESQKIIKGVTFSILSGQTIGIVGKTGSGKSTLIKQLMRQYPVKDKSIYINNIPVEDYKKSSIRECIGYVPQEHMLFSRTVFKNVELGCAEEVDEKEVYEVIQEADFEKDIVNLPNGLDTVVGEYGVTLSGGQKQRLSIARAFMKNADVMILDDSLSAVDGKTESNIIRNLNQYRKNKTNIIVAHRLSAVMGADLILVLDHGQISESGTHEQLMKKQGWYHDLFVEQQMKKEEA